MLHNLERIVKGVVEHTEGELSDFPRTWIFRTIKEIVMKTNCSLPGCSLHIDGNSPQLMDRTSPTKARTSKTAKGAVNTAELRNLRMATPLECQKNIARVECKLLLLTAQTKYEEDEEDEEDEEEEEEE